MNRHHCILSLAALLLAACASAPVEQQSAAASPEQVCERVYKVGVAIPVKECSAPLSDEERLRMQNELRKSAQPGASKPPGG
jgi:hypothetical protein